MLYGDSSVSDAIQNAVKDVGLQTSRRIKIDASQYRREVGRAPTHV